MVKQDNYETLGNLAKIEKTCLTLQDVLSQEVITKIGNSEEAVEYMIKQCTGEFMCELLAKEELIECLPLEVRNRMKENENWKQFITIYEKQDLF